MIEQYRARPVEVEAVTWTGENLDEVAAFLGDAYAGVRRNEHRVQMLLLRTPDNPVTPVHIPPGWKVVRGQGGPVAWAPGAFAESFEQTAPL